MIVSAEQDCIGFRVPPSKPAPGYTIQWSPQWVRTMRGVDTVPPTPVTPPNQYGQPLPGPTLRARVGDLVQLTLLNQIDTGVFPYSIDRGEMSPQGGCDQTTLYPGTGPGADTYPDCFHGSSTANIHFHGTHTNPNTTGDNVFLEIRPSLRTKDQANKPIVTAASVKPAFDEFFKRCEAELPATNPLRQWPFTWNDLPKSYTMSQEKLLKEYDQNPRIGRKLWPVDAKQIAKELWPQYYIGAYPYCYRIPQYNSATWPPSTQAAATAVHTHGEGSAETPEPSTSHLLQMGQSPGTHWYHAHKHGSTAIDVANGMTGAFIIEGQYDDDLDTYYGKGWARRVPVMVIQQIGVAPNLERGGGGTTTTTTSSGKTVTQGTGQDKGPNFSINGSFTPIVKMAPGEVQLWRIVNASGRAGAYLAAPPAGFQWKQIAQDGVQFNDVSYQAHLNTPITLFSGNRADILVMAPATATTTPVNFMVQNEVDPTDLPSAYPMPLLSVNVTGSPATGNNAKFIPTAPTRPPFLADITDGEITGTKKLLFSSEFNGANAPPPSLHEINGHQFNGEVGEVVLLNTVEEWKVSNATYGPLISHPFHIHINPFQVTEVFSPNETLPGTATLRYVFDRAAVTAPGQCLLDAHRPETWHPCYASVAGDRSVWWDVFPIPSGTGATDAKGNPIKDAQGNQIMVPGYFKMRSRFVDYSGYYVIHCHILAHEDRGMMTVVEVAPLQSPYSHH
jgi:FtsP/CotA-like multicopper oxidase with cupredoxin domain